MTHTFTKNSLLVDNYDVSEQKNLRIFPLQQHTFLNTQANMDIL